LISSQPADSPQTARIGPYRPDIWFPAAGAPELPPGSLHLEVEPPLTRAIPARGIRQATVSNRINLYQHTLLNVHRPGNSSYSTGYF